jgi:hypothetical protein
VLQALVEDTQQRLQHLMAMEHEETWTQVGARVGRLQLLLHFTAALFCTQCAPNAHALCHVLPCIWRLGQICTGWVPKLMTPCWQS